MPRRLGQHFLTSPSILERIAHSACPERVELVIEIGPGRGALTEHLLRRSARVVAIEIDTVLVHYLEQKFRHEPRLTVVSRDVLKADLSAWGPAVIAGNLPYYITSPVLERVFAAGGIWKRAVFLVQREVAERVAASPGSRDYGYLSVQSQLNARAEVLFSVGRGAFQPPPKVESAVVSLERIDPRVEDVPAFLSFVSAAFRHKRKTLRNNLLDKYSKEQVDRLELASKRAEELSIPEFEVIRRKLEA